MKPTQISTYSPFSQKVLRAKKSLIAVGLSLFLITGCSTQEILSQDRLDYKTANETNPLEIPPDLISNNNGNQRNATSLREYYQKANQINDPKVLINQSNARIEGEDNNRYIAVTASPDDVWRVLVATFRDSGLQTKVSNPEAGILESNWAENRADIAEGFLRKSITKSGLGFIYSAPTRDMYKARLERRDNNTLIFITHYGMKDQSSGPDNEFHTWVDRPSDPQLSGALLNRVVVKLGGIEKALGPKTKDAQTIASQGNNMLLVNREMQNVWTQVANILDDGSQFKVEQQNAATNSYVVAWNDPNKERSMFSKMAFWKSDSPAQKFNIQLESIKGNATRIQVTELDNSEQSNVETVIRKLDASLI